MNLYAHVAAAATPEDEEPVALQEATIVARADELRAIAAFLLEAADEMQASGAAFEHAHLSDSQEGFEDAPALIVFNPDDV